MKRTMNRGFTLIELLVVIAIIGILASVVLASLNSARSKGADAAASSSLNNARAQAELYYSNNSNSYAGVCAAAADAVPGGIAGNIAGATSASPNTATCHDATGAWAAEIQLSTAGTYYCVDSTGFGGNTTASKGTATVCP